MDLTDTHAHLTYAPLLEQIGDVLARCAEAGVRRIITIGTDVPEARKAVELAARFPQRIYAAAGFHPHHAAQVQDEDWPEMQELTRHPCVVAVGEMGLDYHYDFAPRAAQQAVFRRQLEWAAELDRPVVIHCREAFDDVRAILVEHGFRGRRVVFHCFTGSAEEAAIIAEHGWRISFTGIVTFKNSTALQTVARAYPADQLMIETDCPYLSPVPVRSQKINEPAHVAHIARFLAALRGVPVERLAEETSCNAVEFFGL